jgi:hypothetical protein
MVKSIRPSDGNIARAYSSVRRKNSAIYFLGYSSVMKENTYTTVIKKGEFIFTLLLPQAKAKPQ